MSPNTTAARVAYLLRGTTKYKPRFLGMHWDALHHPCSPNMEALTALITVSAFLYLPTDAVYLALL